ncbi:ATP-binding cassette domain-containing protein, partial [Escherichia coli]|uniref:ATP-binding cassette domain-containing protein n=1 Tax=Escherichia coli TaxID=562 RepID=UPI0019548C9B
MSEPEAQETSRGPGPRVVVVMGVSGSGKSTVLNMIASLIRPTGGEILIDGKRVVPGKATPDVGYVFQRDTLFPWRTVG